jgi:hypothetical protein
MSHYLKEFPDYDAPLPTLEGFSDDSWHNDTCPSLVNPALGLKLWCEYINEDKRECGGARYALHNHEDCTLILASDDIAAIQLAVYIEAMKQEIAQDTVLASCKSFSELHDHCDANMLGFEYLPEFSSTNDMIDFANKGSDAIDQWLKK